MEIDIKKMRDRLNKHERREENKPYQYKPYNKIGEDVVKVVRYQCQYCFKEFKSQNGHRCTFNPKNKSCSTCVNMEFADDGATLICALDNKRLEDKSNGYGIYNCKDWDDNHGNKLTELWHDDDNDYEEW